MEDQLRRKSLIMLCNELIQETEELKSKVKNDEPISEALILAQFILVKKIKQLWRKDS